MKEYLHGSLPCRTLVSVHVGKRVQSGSQKFLQPG
jgi:hypothetical protein